MQFAPSRQRSPVGVVFGSGTRKQQDKVYINAELDKVSLWRFDKFSLLTESPTGGFLKTSLAKA
jgi:hypothetical protein